MGLGMANEENKYVPEGLDYWQDEDEEFPTADWEREVHEGDTRLGYWEWVFSRRESENTI